MPTSYYAVFDGHAGTDAAFYAASQLHEKLVSNAKFPAQPEQALKEAFLETDRSFVNEHENEVITRGFNGQKIKAFFNTYSSVHCSEIERRNHSRRLPLTR